MLRVLLFVVIPSLFWVLVGWAISFEILGMCFATILILGMIYIVVVEFFREVPEAAAPRDPIYARYSDRKLEYHIKDQNGSGLRLVVSNKDE